MIYSEFGSDSFVHILRWTRFKTRPDSGSSKSVLRIRIRIGIRIQWGSWIRIRIQFRNPDPDLDPGRQNDQKK
jgi:hypothetical protein